MPFQLKQVAASKKEIKELESNTIYTLPVAKDEWTGVQSVYFDHTYKPQYYTTSAAEVISSC